MIGIINRSRYLKNAVTYNERKVEKKLATFIDAGFYLQHPALLTRKQKLERLTSRIQLNKRSKVNVLNCSLSFDETQKIPAHLLKQIAAFFLKKIGFHNQPYLVYEHHDSSRQHVHIISTLIRADGSRIEDHHTAKLQRQKAEKETQVFFGLKPRADFESRIKVPQLDAIVSPGPQAKIRSVLDRVLQTYKFSSMPEYNAILRQFGVHALTGRENSRLFKTGGLVYRTLDERGIRSCRAIKASSLNQAATQKALALQFEQNRALQAAYIPRLKNTVDLAIIDLYDLKTLASVLDKQGIKMHLTKQADQSDVSLIYIDNRTRCAVAARRLGQPYSLEGLINRLSGRSLLISSVFFPDTDLLQKEPFWETQPEFSGFTAAADGRGRVDVLLHDLLMPAQDYNPVPLELRKPSKKRKRFSHR